MPKGKMVGTIYNILELLRNSKLNGISFNYLTLLNVTPL